MAEWIVTIVALVGVIITLWQTSTTNAKSQQATQTTVEHLKSEVADIKKTIGNGGFSGLKGEIESMKVHCAAAMTALNAQVSAHLKDDRQ